MGKIWKLKRFSNKNSHVPLFTQYQNLKKMYTRLMSRVNVLLVVHFNSSKCSSVRCFWFYLHLVCICLAMYLNVESVIVRIERKRDKKKRDKANISSHTYNCRRIMQHHFWAISLPNDRKIRFHCLISSLVESNNDAHRDWIIDSAAKRNMLYFKRNNNKIPTTSLSSCRSLVVVRTFCLAFTAKFHTCTIDRKYQNERMQYLLHTHIYR